MRIISFIIFLLSIGYTSFSQSDNPITNNWVTNGSVNAIVHDPNTNITYIGGNFTAVGPSVSCGTVIDVTTGQPNFNYVRPDREIRTSIPDGSGGWYIGGDFTSINGITRNYIARINSDGTLHPWNPNANSAVYTLARSGSTVYVGGVFTNIGGEERSRIAALDAGTGNATVWNPNANNTVWSIFSSGSTIYVGGEFSNIGGQTRNRIAAINASTGIATSWNPDANNTVYSCLLSGSTVYVGGNFTSIGGQSRNRIAAINASTGIATSWNPNANNSVYTLALSGSTVYAGGGFTNIGGQSRNRIAALDVSTGNATAWNPDANAWVSSIALIGSTIYVGGYFTSIGSQTRNYFAAVDASTGNPTAWNPSANNYVNCLAINGSTLFAGGNFSSLGVQERNRLAAINGTTGAATSWNPGADNQVNCLVLSGSKIYVGGFFFNIGGQARSRIAALDLSTGNATLWNPNANQSVETIAIDGSTIYAGGWFTNIGGQTRNYIAALDATTGTATSWNPNANDRLYDLVLSGQILYAGGGFTSIGGQSRNRLAAFNTTTGNITSWNPSADNFVMSIAVNNSTVYVGGYFTNVGGQSRNLIAAVDANTGNTKAWNPNPNFNSVNSILISGSKVYAGGAFSVIGGQSRFSLAAIDTSTGNATSWNPNGLMGVHALALSSSTIYVGGDFTSIGGQMRQGFAAFPHSVTWGGSWGGNWDVDSNWIPHSVPTRTTNIIVNNGYPTLNVDHTVDAGYSLTLSNSGELLIDQGQTLIISGTADFGNKPVMLKSGPSGTASIGSITGTLTGATNVTVERYIPPNEKWRGLCMPLSSATAGNSIYNSWQNNGIVIPQQGVLLWSSTPATGFSLNTNPGASQNIRKYIGGSGFSLLSNTDEPLFSEGKPVPYLVFVTDYYKTGTNVGNMGSGATLTTLSATGTLYQGSYTSGTLGPGFHMIPNPYPSAINFNDVTITGDIEKIFWVWDPLLEGFRGFGGYLTYSNGVFAPVGGSYSSSTQWPILPSESAFWVNSTGSGTVQMNESSKDNNNYTSFNLFGRVAENRNQILSVNLLNQSEKLLDGVAAVFNANASMGNDKMDAVKFGLGAENIFIRSNNKNLAIEFHPPVQQADTFYLVLNQLSQKTYHLQLSGKDIDVNPNLIAVLEDQYLKKETILDLNGINKVAFTVDAQPASSGNRFRVVFRQNATTSVNTFDVDKGISVYPNPAIKGQSIQLSFNNQPAGIYRMILFDIAGVQVMNRVLQHSGGTAVQSVTLTDKIVSGNYVAELSDAKGNKKQVKITVQ